MAMICFISLGSVAQCPYVYKYKEFLKSGYDCISWKREDFFIEDARAENEYVFEYNLNFQSKKTSKLKAYFYYRKFLVNILKVKQYKKIILLQTGLGVLLNDFLIKHYRDKFILDIRDYFAEYNKLIFEIEKRVINASKYTIISSRGYEAFLPVHDYIMVHNNQVFDYSVCNKIHVTTEPINVNFVGSVVYIDIQKKLLMKLANDSRFQLNYYGGGSEILKKYCNEKGILNVDFKSAFVKEDILKMYLNADIVNNVYGNNTPALDFALSNKLYFAAELGLPILVCKETYMESVTAQYDMGYVVDFEDENFADHLFEYYSCINWDKLKIRCNEFMETVYQDNKEFEMVIGGYLSTSD